MTTETTNSTVTTSLENRTEFRSPDWLVRLLGPRAPVAYQAGDGNMYRYVANAPTTHVDPSGLVAIRGARIISTGTFADIDRAFRSGNPIAEAWNAVSRQHLEPLVPRLGLVDPRDPRRAWNPRPINSFDRVFNVTSADGQRGFISARFALLVDLDERRPGDCVRNVTIRETASHYLHNPRNGRFDLMRGNSYADRVKADREIPTDLSVLGALRESSTISIGKQFNSNDRTLVVFDAPSYEYILGTAPSRSVGVTVIIEDVAGQRAEISYDFTLGLDPRIRPMATQFVITRPRY